MSVSWILYVTRCRIYQTLFRLAAYALPWHEPEVFSGADALTQAAKRLREKDTTRVLLVTDAGVVAAGLVPPVLTALEAVGIYASIYDRTVANPTVTCVEEALTQYRNDGCQALVALGGGSPIDCAKGVGMRLARPHKAIGNMRRQLRVLRRIPMLAAVPTTAGTGSETTLAAVITDGDTHEKYAVNDPALIPHVAVLDAALTCGLPSRITAETGMDALVHAVEAYIGGSNTAQTRRDALDAMRLIFANLPRAYTHGDNLDVRAAMQQAAYLAGRAFTRAYVGYVHAIAHTLGGQYGTPHGLANAVILPYVLEAYGASANRRLAEIAEAVGIGTPNQTAKERASAFVAAVRTMSRDIGIPERLSDLRAEDIPTLTARALREANPLYPVPRIFDSQKLAAIYRLLLTDTSSEI